MRFCTCYVKLRQDLRMPSAIKSKPRVGAGFHCGEPHLDPYPFYIRLPYDEISWVCLTTLLVWAYKRCDCYV